MNQLDALLAAKEAADAALADAEAALLARLVAAKDAHRADPNPATAAEKAVAVAEMRAYRAVQRQGRTQTTVGGDAFLSPVQNVG